MAKKKKTSKLKITKVDKYKLAIFLILLLAFVLRFWRIGNRWFVFSDTARDILVGRETVKSWQFPLVGSFSSAGPFVFGPLFYWLIALSYLPNVNWLILPWITVGLISLVFVWVMAKTGERLWGKKGAIILGLLSAVSPAQLFRSLGLTQHSLIGISGAVALFSFVSYLKDKKSIYLFLMGLGLGFGLSMHYQAINLLPFALAVFITPKFNLKKIVKNLAFLLAGLLIPSLSLMYWDSLQSWANFRNLLDYLFIGQYRIYVANRWLTFAFDFWPDFWGSIIGGGKLFGWFFIFLTLVTSIRAILRKKLSKTVFLLGVILFLQFILLRYHRGERFEGYLIYFHPLILFFSAWGLVTLAKSYKKIVFFIVLIVVIFGFKIFLPEMLLAQNQTPILEKIVKTLKERYPEKKFSIYDYNFASSAYSYGISVFLDKEGLIDKEGIPIGVCSPSCPQQFPLISDLYEPAKVVDISSLPKEEFKKPTWNNVNPRVVFEEVTLWWQKEKLTSPFSLKKFLLEKFYNFF